MRLWQTYIASDTHLATLYQPQHIWYSSCSVHSLCNIVHRCSILCMPSYRIVGNFWGRNFCKCWGLWLFVKVFLRNLRAWRSFGAAKQAICESFLCKNRIFHQFVKVFSLESFPLYSKSTGVVDPSLPHYKQCNLSVRLIIKWPQGGLSLRVACVSLHFYCNIYDV